LEGDIERKFRRSKSDDIPQHFPLFKQYAKQAGNECLQQTNDIMRRRFSGIADYYKKYNQLQLQSRSSDDDDDEFNETKIADDASDDSGSVGSISPMSTVYHPDRTWSPTSHLYDGNNDECKLYETPSKLSSSSHQPRRRHLRRTQRHASNTTTIFEDIMMNTTVLDGIRTGKLHRVIHECSASDIANFFPIIAAIICNIPYGLSQEQETLLQAVRERALHNAGLRQTIQFFMICNQNNDLIRKIWRHSAFMIALDCSHSNTNTKRRPSGVFTYRLCDDDILHSMHSSPERARAPYCSTTDDLNLEELAQMQSPETPYKHRRRFTRGYVQKFTDNVQVFRWMLDNGVGCEFAADANSQDICDPLHENRKIHRMRVQKIFNSAAKPALIETFDEHNRRIGQCILKQGDDLRQDMNMMYMLHIMNAIWEEHGAEFKQHPIRALTYLCVAMDADFGCIELVEDCVPLRNISSLQHKFESDPHLINNLIASAVGSYLAAYCLGVGDRHFDNILIRSTDGTLFHIDFGYIFGQKVAMDTNEFAITNDLYSIINDHDEALWAQFIDASVAAFMILRTHVDELVAFADIAWTFVTPSSVDVSDFLHRRFEVNKTDDEARQMLRSKLEQAPFAWNTRMKNVMHSWATSTWYPRNIDLFEF